MTHQKGGQERAKMMAKIGIVLILIAAFVGCYPPSYYDRWNTGSVQRYLESEDEYTEPYVYYRPHAMWYPYFYVPFSLSLSFSSIQYDTHFRRIPYYRHFGWARPHYHLRYGGRR